MTDTVKQIDGKTHQWLARARIASRGSDAAGLRLRSDPRRTATPPAPTGRRGGRRGGWTRLVFDGDFNNMKVTTMQDLREAEARLSAVAPRSGSPGFRRPRLRARRSVQLGGVLVPHDKKLAGHSDADVALHAIADADLRRARRGRHRRPFPAVRRACWRG